MPSFVPRRLEPYQKREILDKRLLSLRGAINSGASDVRITHAAEKVRLSALTVIKAQRSLLAERPESEARARQLQNLSDEEERWNSLSVEAIIAQATAADASP